VQDFMIAGVVKMTRRFVELLPPTWSSLVRE